MKPELSFIMEKRGKKFMLFACRGVGRGCPRNKFRSRRVHCDDCVPADDENETLEHFKTRLERGDA
jgi:hypothetical protein